MSTGTGSRNYGSVSSLHGSASETKLQQFAWVCSENNTKAAKTESSNPLDTENLILSIRAEIAAGNSDRAGELPELLIEHTRYLEHEQKQQRHQHALAITKAPHLVDGKHTELGRQASNTLGQDATGESYDADADPVKALAKKAKKEWFWKQWMKHKTAAAAAAAGTQHQIQGAKIEKHGIQIWGIVGQQEKPQLGTSTSDCPFLSSSGKPNFLVCANGDECSILTGSKWQCCLLHGGRAQVGTYYTTY
jgi:hypothetical protein